MRLFFLIQKDWKYSENPSVVEEDIEKGNGKYVNVGKASVLDKKWGSLFLDDEA